MISGILKNKPFKKQSTLTIKLPAILVVFIGMTTGLIAQGDSTSTLQKEKRRTGWTWAALPVLAYDADQGLHFGALGQVFDYGDGSTWPEYKHTIYAECSWYTRGGSVYQVFYDSKYLIPGGIRVTADVDYLPEKALDFYGFNGYVSNYEPGLTDQSSSTYISRMFYRMERKMLRIILDFQGPIVTQKFRWMAGLSVIGMETGTVDINRLNQGRDEEDKLPDTALLYDRYVQYGLISDQEKEGNTTVFLKTGLTFDTRDNEAAPEKGMWSEAMLVAAPGFLGNSPFAFTSFSAAHRQYFTIFPKRVVIAGQLRYQGKLGGNLPFYMMPYLFRSFDLSTKPDGLGGSESLRGILRNRITGEGIAYGNMELRWKIFRGVILKQSVYVMLNLFMEGGMVVQQRKMDLSGIPETEKSLYFKDGQDHLHMTTGAGLRIGLNQNFIVAIDYGIPWKPQDGKGGLYIGLGNLF